MPDSGSGPRRRAAELGNVTLHASRPGTDGSGASSVTVRVVVSAYASTKEAHTGAGIWRNGFVYELFLTNLGEDAWPPAELVQLYYDRSTVENRLSQVRREFPIDRLLCTAWPGQAVCTTFALYFWNQRLQRGFTANPPPAVKERAVARRGRHVPAPSFGADADAPVVPAGKARPVPTDSLESVAEDERDLLRALPWEKHLRRRDPRFTWKSEPAQLRCPAGHLAVLRSIARDSRKRWRSLRFHVSNDHCAGCPLRQACIDRESPQRGRIFAISVPEEVGVAVRALRRRRRQVSRILALPDLVAGPTRRARHQVRLSSGARSGPHACQFPRFLPAEARRSVPRAVGAVSLRVREPRLGSGGAAGPHALQCGDAASRSHRRRTWAERARYNRLPEGVHIRLTVQVAEESALAVLRRGFHTLLGE